MYGVVSSSSSGDDGLVLARVHRHLEDGVAEAAVARPVQARREGEREDRARRRPRQLEGRRHLLRHRQVALAAVLQRRQLHLELVAQLLARTQLHLTQVEARHSDEGSRLG